MDALEHHRPSRLQGNNWRISTWVISGSMIALLFHPTAWASDPQKEKELSRSKAPETVFVSVEKARLYAGPSTDFYPTGETKRGEALEVHLRTQDGWLGIRPPQGSFSWVPASQAYLLPGGRVIEITDSSAVSWIGTELGSAKQYRWQVQLNVGEQLSVLDEATVRNGSDDRDALWYKVSPPAGEFRWIEQSAVSTTAPEIITQVAEENTSPSKAKQASVQTASFTQTPNAEVKTAAAEQTTTTSQPATPSVASRNQAGKNTKSTAQNASSANRASPPQRGAGSAKSKSAGSEWDGWHAFEMSDQGVRAPFLDKLSGRDRSEVNAPKSKARQRDPLLDDPFSLTMTGQAPKQSKENLAEVDSEIRKQRDWRDPRQLREARLASRLQGSDTLPMNSLVESFDRALSRSLPPDDAVRQASGLGSSSGSPMGSGLGSPLDSPNVSTAGYTTGPIAEAGFATGSSANVNWYGITENRSESKPSAMQGNVSPASASSPQLVTSTADVAELQLALNSMVSTSSGPWNLAPLAERAHYLIEHGPTAIDRGQARLLLERIEAFQSLSTRSQQLAGPQLPGQPAVQSASFATPTLGGQASRFDATGWLVPVHSATQDQPTHALTNDRGDIVAYVSPAPGLNLDRYRNQAVGITGLRGYLPQLQAAHIEAQRVSRVR